MFTTTTLVAAPGVLSDTHRRVLQELGVRDVVSRDVDPRALARGRNIMAISQAVSLPTPLVGTAPPFQGWKVLRGREADWLLCPVEEDPVFQRLGGRLPAPAAVVERVQKLVAAGVDFDRVYIAHEMPPGTENDAIVEVIQPPTHPHARNRMVALGRVVAGLWQGVAAAALTALMIPAGLVAMAGGVGTPATPASSATFPAMAALDPVLLGVLDAGRTGLWFYIAHWRWEGEDAPERNAPGNAREDAHRLTQ